jgi:histidinol phosphatase-like PHP family hydrolase
LEYAKQNKLKKICLTNHFWDESVPPTDEFYNSQSYKHISKTLPLPQTDDIQFLFGCEVDMDKNLTLGISRDRFDSFDMILISINHFQLKGITVSDEDYCNPPRIANLWVEHFNTVLDMDLPFHKIGFSHLTASLMVISSREKYLEVLNLIDSSDMQRLFKRAAELGAGIELNARDMGFSEEEADTVLRPYRIAKECGCKFYLGSDSHHPQDFEKIKNFHNAIDLLELEEDDKFHIARSR